MRGHVLIPHSMHLRSDSYFEGTTQYISLKEASEDCDGYLDLSHWSTVRIPFIWTVFPKELSPQPFDPSVFLNPMC